MAITEITTKSIKDGEVVNADVNANAAIAGTKVSPDFGSQNIVTTGTVSSGDITISDTNPMLTLTDTDTDDDFSIRGSMGKFRIRSDTDSADRFTINSTGNVDIPGNLDVGDGLDVTGAIVSTTSITDSKGDVRSIPSNAKSSAYVAVAADAGKAIYISTGGVTLNDSVFSAGDAVTIINNSGSDQTITQGSGVTLYNTADASTGNNTLAGRGMATVWFAAANIAYISGSGLS